MRLKPYKVDNEPSNATKVVTLVKNVQTCRNSLYNLHHHGSAHFCHLLIWKDTRQFTDPATRIKKEKKYNTVKDIIYTYNTVIYDDDKLSTVNSR